MINTFALIIALLLLVTIHEYGHFLAAKLCKVKILCFSIGFGKKIFSHQAASGTEYRLSLLPLGGYVKMLEGSEKNITKAERKYTFNNQKLWKRFFIVLAGPLFNFLFAFFLLWCVHLIGVVHLSPIVAEVYDKSIAAHAGMKSGSQIVAVDERAVNNWLDFQFAVMAAYGSKKEITLKLLIPHFEITNVKLNLTNWEIDENQPDLLKSLGIKSLGFESSSVIDSIIPNSPAAQIKLKSGDRIIKINNTDIKNWSDCLSIIQSNPNKKITLVISRDNKLLTMPVVLSENIFNKQKIGFLGIKPVPVKIPANLLVLEKKNVLTAVTAAFYQTKDLISGTLLLLNKFIFHEFNINHLSGPIGIAQGIIDSAKTGITNYLFFLALISVSLGIINLLPIPLLDGGYLLFFVYELLFGKPISEKKKNIGLSIGFVVLFSLTFLALNNDLTHLINKYKVN